MTDDDRRLAERLSRYESHVPVDAHSAVTARPRRGPWPLLGGMAAVLVLTVVVAIASIPALRGVADATVGPSPSATDAVGSLAAEPPVSTSAASSPPIATTPSPVPATPTSTPLPSGAAAVVWSAGASQDGRVSAVAHHGGMWFAGGAFDDGTASRAAVWSSADGRSWTGPVLLPPETTYDDTFPRRYWVNSIGSWDGGLLAFGFEGIGCCDAGNAMMWSSRDGTSWSVVDTRGTAFNDIQHFPRSSVTTPAGELALLSATSLGGAASVFLTSDAVAWTEHPIPSSDPHFSVHAIASWPNGLVAVGSHTPGWEDAPRPEQRVWTSLDGRSWSPVEPPSALGELSGIAWDPVRERFLAVGTDGEERPTVWSSADGSTWAGTALDDAPGSVDSIAAADGLLVAGGHEGGRMHTSGRTVAWTSHDGVTWQVVPLGERSTPIVGATPTHAILVSSLFRVDASDSWAVWEGAVGE